MKAAVFSVVTLLFLVICVDQTYSFVRRLSPGRNPSNKLMSAETNEVPMCELPGDPSLLLTTNVDLKDKKLEIMKSTVHGLETEKELSVTLSVRCSTHAVLVRFSCRHFEGHPGRHGEARVVHR
jgi:hypothetical protein